MYIDKPVEPKQLELHFCFCFSFLDVEFRKDDDDSVEKKNIELRGIEEETY